MAIQIKTRLHDGIYQSCGGGQIRVVLEFATGPRNLLKAIAALNEIRRDNKQAYGNIGCGITWLEIEGTPLADYYESELEYSGIKGNGQSPTDLARDIVTKANSGELRREYDAYNKRLDQWVAPAWYSDEEIADMKRENR